MWLTKVSAAFLFLRLSPDRTHIITSKALLGASTVFMVVSLFIVAIRCDVAEPWVIADGQCASAVSPVATGIYPTYLHI